LGQGLAWVQLFKVADGYTVGAGWPGGRWQVAAVYGGHRLWVSTLQFMVKELQRRTR